MLKKDNLLFGLVLGVILPIAIYGIVYMIMIQWGTIDKELGIFYLKESTMQLIGVFANLFSFRYYMVTLKLDKTGRGILMATFIYAGIYFYQHLLG